MEASFPHLGIYKFVTKAYKRADSWISTPTHPVLGPSGFCPREASFTSAQLGIAPHPQAQQASGKESHIYRTETPWQGAG